MWLKLVIAIFSIASLVACEFTVSDDISKELPPEVRIEVDRLNEATLAKDFESIFRNVHKELKPEITPEFLGRLSRFVHGNEIVKGEVVSVTRKSVKKVGDTPYTTFDIIYTIETDISVLEMTYGLLSSDWCCEIYNYGLSLEDFDGEIVIEE